HSNPARWGQISAIGGNRAPTAAAFQWRSETSLHRPVVTHRTARAAVDRARHWHSPGVATDAGAPPSPAPAPWPNFRRAAPAATTPAAAPAVPHADQYGRAAGRRSG